MRSLIHWWGDFGASARPLRRPLAPLQGVWMLLLPNLHLEQLLQMEFVCRLHWFGVFHSGELLQMTSRVK